MADKFASRITAGVLLALTFGALIPVSVLAQNRNALDQRFIPGTTYSGYNRGLTGATAGNYWWYGGAGGGYPYGGYGGGNLAGNLTGASSELLYPSADGPMPTTAPVPSYQTEAMDNLATTHQTPHNDGPSMSLTPDQMDMPKVSSYFHGFYKDMQMGAEYGRSQGDVSAQVATAPQQQRTFARPPVQSNLTSMDFTSKARTISGTAIGVRTDVRPKLAEAEQQFKDAKTSGQLGTFDIEPLETQMKDLRRRASEVYNIQSDVEQRAEEGKLINDIDNFEYQLKQHTDGNGM